MLFIDLFCGLGAFHQSLEKLGHTCVFASDINQGIRELYERNYGLHCHGDITTIESSNIPQFDILCAGFPCQPFSIAGNKAGFSDKTRGTLFHEIIRILEYHHPKYAVLENVKNIIGHDNSQTLTTILEALDNVGYKVAYKVLNAGDLGVPQSRERVYFVCIRKDLEDQEFTFTEHTTPTCRIADIVDTGVQTDLRTQLSEKYEFKAVSTSKATSSKPKLLYNLILKSTQKGGRQGERIYSMNHPGITICSGSGGPGSNTGLYEINGQIRKLTLPEVIKMFGFSKQLDFSGYSEKQIMNYFGNSICVPVLDSIFSKLFNSKG